MIHLLFPSPDPIEPLEDEGSGSNHLVSQQPGPTGRNGMDSQQLEAEETDDEPIEAI